MNNFGGNSSDDITFRHSSNAYMLVYVRDSCKDEILHEVDKDDIPANLHDRLSEERRVELIKKKERSEAPNFMQLNLFLEEEFLKHSGAELYDVYKVEATKQVKIRKMDTVLRVKQSLCESFVSTFCFYDHQDLKCEKNRFLVNQIFKKKFSYNDRSEVNFGKIT